MKVVYINPFRDGTGYAHAGIHTALALDKAGFDLVPRCLKLAGQYVEMPQRLIDLEKKSSDGADVVIQHLLPPMYTYRAGFKNIGYFHCETDHFRPSLWQAYLNLMDEIWVCSQQNKEAAIKSGVVKPIKVVPIPCDPAQYRKEYPKLHLFDGSPFVFYHVGDYSERKNIDNLIRAYYEEFTRQDNVVLVLKTYKEGKSPQESNEILKQNIRIIKSKMRKYNIDIYPPIILITDYIDESYMMALHQLGHCFVSLERGAAWNIPAFDAMAFGNHVVVNGWGGQDQFVTGENALRLSYNMISVYGMDHVQYNGLYTSYEKWAEPDFEMAKAAMRNAYQKGKVKVDRSKWLEEWSYESLAPKFKGILECV
jgi:glycosyltransferase involved in cell wall biosynthesis